MLFYIGPVAEVSPAPNEQKGLIPVKGFGNGVPNRKTNSNLLPFARDDQMVLSRNVVECVSLKGFGVNLFAVLLLV